MPTGRRESPSGEPEIPSRESEIPSGDPAAEEPAEGPSPPGWVPELKARVVDVRTGEPVAGATAYYGPFPDWWGATSDAEGSFRFEVSAKGRDPGRVFRLRVIAPGYEMLDVVPRDGEIRLELIPRTGPPALGRIRGRALDAEGRPLRGVVAVVLGDEVARRHWLAVLADEFGEFELVGVDPGGRRIELTRGDAMSVFVPEGGEAPVTIRGSVVREELEGAWGHPVRREVQVTDIPGPDGCRLVAESTTGGSAERWWAVVRDGKARFPALYPGRWTLTRQSADGDESGVVEVPEAGDVRFP